ncbi:MAG: glycoside hydrolase family 3 C-terminal domain-containing protein [Ignavibacteriae bacterium]|nr:glycoside hydrolase family 3 C-terminal domain-containing protein [Ignavibacteriota bacterium]
MNLKRKLSFRNIIFFSIFFILNYQQIYCQNNSLDEKAKEIISKLKVEEKIGLIVGDGRFLPSAEIPIEKVNDVYIANRNSKIVIPRLKLKSTALTDGPSGINKSAPPEGVDNYTFTTAFPTSTCLAATWNTELVQKIGEALGNELLEYDYDLILMPALNLHRNPNCGRNFEYYSEDPLLSGKISAAIVNGIQSKGVSATLKHFLANNQESNRRKYNAVISQRALREIYLKGFEIAVKESKPKSIMTSYNRLNGFYTAENPELLKEIVRNEWKFDGLFMTDFDGYYGDAVAKVRAGNNLLMSGNKDEINELTNAIQNKSISESLLDESLIYNIKLKLDSPSMKGYKPSFKPNLNEHAKLAREAASEGIVLLKNNNVLPLKSNLTIALFGKISYYLIETGTGSGGINSNKYAISVCKGLQSNGFKILPELENLYTEYIEQIKKENLVPDYFNNPKMRADNGITNDQAPPHFKKRLVAFSRDKKLSLEEINRYESTTDVAIITLGRSGGENYENGYLPITEIELELVKNVSEIFHVKNKKVIVVLNVGGVWETESWQNYVDAILLMWQPGQEGGNALADIISGKINPSGKLPDSFPIKYEDVPSAKSFPGEPKDEPVNSFYDEGIYVGYRYYNTFNIPTSYEFGFGLSYTNFEFSDLAISNKKFNGKIEVSVKIKNIGKVAGKEVVQLYLSAPQTEIEKPIYELKRFVKTKLLVPGESQQLNFSLDTKSLSSFWSGISSWVADKGEYKIYIGSSSKELKLSETFQLDKDILVEKVHDVLYPNFLLKEFSQRKK